MHDAVETARARGERTGIGEGVRAIGGWEGARIVLLSNVMDSRGTHTRIRKDMVQ